MNRKQSFAIAFLAVFAVVLSFGAGYIARELSPRQQSGFPVLLQAYDILLDNAYDPIPEGPDLEYGMIRGMVDAYGDPFTSFSEPVQHELQTNDLEGVFGGIGTRIERGPDGEVLLYPFPDGPAARAGILPGAELTAVDDLAVSEKTDFDSIRAAIRGPEGSRVRIDVLQSSGEGISQFTITRENVPLPSVTWRLAIGQPAVGIIEVNLMADTTVEEILRAASELEEQGVKRFVLDLRDNGGGLLDAGIACARLFLSEGIVIEQQFRDHEILSYGVETPGELAEIPLIVWVNHGTASAAEICAGAIQAHGRALLAGTHTFGKDAIQLVFELQDGSSIQVTAARWWIPGSNFPNGGQGLVPEINAETDQDYMGALAAYP